MAKRTVLAQQLRVWRYGHDGAERFSASRHGASRTLVELCVRALAKEIAAGRLDLLKHGPWVPVEFLEATMRTATELSPHTITDETVSCFITCCGDSLLRLHANGCHKVTDTSVKAACKLCPLLRHVDLRGTSVSEQGVIALGKHLKRLETVWVSETAVSDFAVTRLLLSLPQLCDLGLRNCPKLGDDAVAALVRLTALKALDLGGLSRVSEEALVRVVRTNSNLTLLNFTKCSLVGSDLVLSLSKCHLVKDSGLSRLSMCRHLKELDLSELECITDSPIMAILGACSLRALVLRACKRLTDASLQVLGRTQKELKMLDISHSCHFSDGGLHTLLLAPSLQVLNAAYCPKIGDAGLRRLCCAHLSCSSKCRAVTGLRELNLTDTSVTTEALIKMVSVRTSLTLLIIAGLMMTEEAVTSLQVCSMSVTPTHGGHLRIITDWEKQGRILLLPSLA